MEDNKYPTLRHGLLILGHMLHITLLCFCVQGRCQTSAKILGHKHLQLVSSRFCTLLYICVDEGHRICWMCKLPLPDVCTDHTNMLSKVHVLTPQGWRLYWVQCVHVVLSTFVWSLYLPLICNIA